ncbi:hypothetical protein H5203_21460 [Pseudoalteromonas sp. SG41-1]|uniref:hypothetical protein n=1 Tax=Pseudoalteromonas sp. SG41-1 TaxID=2760979 RepID=UPI0016024765|nr:hypothetical protein [Pseudoalteromonas sp. SG41-1]MBB1508014.1 hypothetical protein [Pseudoalteromonas sp. SG41-1]
MKKSKTQSFLYRYKKRTGQIINAFFKKETNNEIIINDISKRKVANEQAIKITEKSRSQKLSALNDISDTERMLAKFYSQMKTDNFIEDLQHGKSFVEENNFKDYLYMFNEYIHFSFDSDSMNDEVFTNLNKQLSKIKSQFIDFKMKFYKQFIDDNELAFMNTHISFIEWKRKIQSYLTKKDLGAFCKIFDKEDFIIVEKVSGNYNKGSNEIVPIMYNNSEKQFLSIRQKLQEITTGDLDRSHRTNAMEKLNSLLENENRLIKKIVLSKKNNDEEMYQNFINQYKQVKAERLGCSPDEVYVPRSFTIDKINFGSNFM